jgi:hypothetical protein
MELKLADEKNAESNKTACPAIQQKFQDPSTLNMECLQRPPLFPVAFPPSEVHTALQLKTKTLQYHSKLQMFSFPVQKMRSPKGAES